MWRKYGSDSTAVFHLDAAAQNITSCSCGELVTFGHLGVSSQTQFVHRMHNFHYPKTTRSDYLFHPTRAKIDPRILACCLYRMRCFARDEIDKI
jgi:hypothetical protein